MPHTPRHSGGFSQGQSVIGGGSSPTPSAPQQPSNPQDYFGSMYTSPGSSTQVTNQPPSVGFNVGQVDPGLMSGVMQVQGKTKQEADRIAQQAMGNTGQGFGITGTETLVLKILADLELELMVLDKGLIALVQVMMVKV